MIKIINEQGDTAELYPDTSITIEKNNPLFNDDDKFFEDITYSFKMPATASNKIFFKWGHLVETENQWYSFQVSCIVDGFPFFAGNISFRFVDNEFDVLLLINYGSLRDRVSKVKLTEIYTADARKTELTASFMKTVCTHPDQYPFSFFPVKNPEWEGLASPGVSTYTTVNNWDHESQSFIHLVDFSEPLTPQSIYFKLKYIVSKVMECLGFSCAGTWMEDASTSEIYLYNRIYVRNFLYDSSCYWPSMTIEEFFKLLKERFGLTISFDVFSGIVEIDSGPALLAREEMLDIRGNISSVDEISVPEVKGYTISLKPDENDPLFIDPADSSKRIPTNRLLIGQAEKPIEIKASTLKTFRINDEISIPHTSQKLYARGGLHLVDFKNTDLPRFLRYSGMKAVSGGKVYPQAVPMELGEDDTVWPRFLNDSKELRITAFLRPGILAGMRSTQQIGILTAEGVSARAICKRILYNLTNRNVELISTSIECRMLISPYSTPVAIEESPKTVNEAPYNSFKAYFPAETGLNSIDIGLFYPAGTETFVPGEPFTGWNVLPGPVTFFGTIDKSTDRYRGGGTITFLEHFSVSSASLENIEVRVYSGVPKYIIWGGDQFDFESSPDGYWFSKPLSSGTAGIDGNPFWIVF